MRTTDPGTEDLRYWAVDSDVQSGACLGLVGGPVLKTKSATMRRRLGVAIGLSVLIGAIGATLSAPVAQAASITMARYGTSADESFTTLTRLSTGGFVTSGYQYNRATNHWRTFLMKYDDAGKRLWSKDIAIEPYFAFESAGEIILADDTFRVAAYSLSGTKLWTKTLTSNQRDCARESLWSFAPSANGFLALSDCANDDPGTPSALVGRYDSKGELDWERAVPPGTFESAQVLTPTADGGYIVGGRIDNGNVPNCTNCSYASPSNPVMTKYDSLGNLEWTYADDRSAPVYAGVSHTYDGITELSNGGYVALMRVESNDAEVSSLARFDASGHKIWDGDTRCAAASAYHPATQVLELGGGFATIGVEQSGLCMWNSDGQYVWGVAYKGVQLEAVVRDGRDGLIAAGDAGKSASVVGGNSGGRDAVVGHFDASGHLSPWQGVLSLTPTPTLDGSLPVTDQTLSAEPGTWGPAGVSLRYQWYRKSASGKVTGISGATTHLYKVKASDVGYRLRVKVSGSLSGYKSVSKSSTWTSKVTKAQFATTPTPTVSGVARVGMPLTGVPGSWVPSATFKYQWYRVSGSGKSSAISGATKGIYRPISADVGKALKLRVKGYRDGYVTAVRYSAPTSLVQPGMVAAIPRVTGTSVVDQELTANEGNWTPAAPETTYSYQWYAKNRSGKLFKIDGATSRTYRVDGRYGGYRLKVAVVGNANGYAPLTKTSAYTITVAKAKFTTAPPTIIGTAQIGQNLTVDEGDWLPAPTFGYQWYRSGAPITGATSNVYSVVGNDLGKTITVKVTATRTGYVPASQISAPTPAVTA